MKTYTLHLPDEIAERVQAYAHTQQEPPEEALLRVVEERFAVPAPTFSPLPSDTSDDPDGAKAVEALLGSIPHWPDMQGKGTTHTTNEDIDRLIGEEAMNPHDDL